MKKAYSWKLYLLIVALSCFPLIDIFTNSYLPHTSDGAMHVVRTGVYFKELLAGQFPVRWASQLDYGYGTPLFIFFNPLAYIVGAGFLFLGFNSILTLKLGFALTYFLAGIFTFLFARAFFKNDKTAILVTILYQYAPFRLVEMLVRGNLGSLYSYAVLPLVLYAITKFVEKRNYWYFILIAVSVALLPLSHTIIGFIFFALTVPFVLLVTRERQVILKTYGGILLGLLLSATFIIPALIEHKYTNGYLFTKDLFWNHFPRLFTLFLPNIMDNPSLRTAEVSVQIGLFHEIIFFLACLLLVLKKFTKKTMLPVLYLVLATIATICFIEPITKPIWIHVSFVRQFQFPWRFLAIICFTTAFLGGFVYEKISFLKNTLIFCILLVLIIASTFYYWKPYQGYQHFNESYFWNFPGSTNYFAEINTIWMEHEPVTYPNKRVELIGGEGTVSQIKISPEKHIYTVNAKNNVSIVDRTYFFPGWKVSVDGKLVPIQFQDQNYRGLITFSVNPGKHKIVVYRTESQLELASDAISVFAICVLIFSWVFFRKKEYGKAK